jgi:carboxyl-terminal processing protease
MRNALAVLGVSILLAVSMPNFAGAQSNSETYRQLDLFGEVFNRVRADYVDEVDDEKLIEAAVNGMLQALDPHSGFLNAKNFREMQVQTRGEFGGLGIEVTMENGYVKVISPIDGTPAERAGILTGDLVTHIGGEAVQGLTLSQAVARSGQYRYSVNRRTRRGRCAVRRDTDPRGHSHRVGSLAHRRQHRLFADYDL